MYNGGMSVAEVATRTEIPVADIEKYLNGEF